MAWPEPSMNDCGADWNAQEISDENGDIVAVLCGYPRCRKARRDYDD